MKIKIVLIILLVVFASSVVAFDGNKASEPPQTYKLVIDGIEHKVTTQSETTINIAGKERDVSLSRAATRKFGKAGVEFEFNSNLHFSYEQLLPGVDFWSLDGNESVIMIQSFTPKTEFKAILESFLTQYRQMKAKIKQSDISIQVQDKRKTGVKLAIKFGEIKLEQQIFYFESSTSSIAVILQDSIAEGNNNSQEFLEMRKLFERTFKFSSKG